MKTSVQYKECVTKTNMTKTLYLCPNINSRHSLKSKNRGHSQVGTVCNLCTVQVYCCALHVQVNCTPGEAWSGEW